MKYYFAYGMNTNLREMNYRCPAAVCIGPAKILDHKLVFRTHADIEYSPGDVIRGVLWKISPHCETSLDMLEGYPYYYDKRDFIAVLDTPMLDMTHIVAMAYQMTEQQTYTPPGTSYLNCLLEGYEDNGVATEQIYQALEQADGYKITL